MVTDDKKESKALTREQYRKLKQQEDDDFKQRDKKRVEVERAYARTHQQNPGDDAVIADANQFKTPRWHKINRRLNWTIGILAVLIVIVYLVLFFVN
ncbi:MAG: hypothetical protein LKJ64_04350 [Lentilactobacillus buchneri]|nr:hypothetical protein [Lentilactobacillus buchneri]MCI2019935.1 hypothetical protein [Lentilactobacillus buchneri]MCI2028216.1 hypothetical protein [Lentilactobacillus buchneri]